MNSSCSTARYRLSPHVNACRTEDYIVLLDLKRCRYVGAPIAQMERAGVRIGEEPKRTDEWLAEDESELLQQMLNEGLLLPAERAVSRERFVSAHIERPASALIDGYAEATPIVRLIDLVRFLRAFSTALLLLHGRSFESLVGRARARRARRGAVAAAHGTLSDADLNRARTQVALFEHLRPLFFTHNQKCLLNTLALGEFLFQRDLFPQVVFGVRSSPFGAHCWMQHGGVVFNDTPQYVSRFTPILVL